MDSGVSVSNALCYTLMLLRDTISYDSRTKGYRVCEYFHWLPGKRAMETWLVRMLVEKYTFFKNTSPSYPPTESIKLQALLGKDAYEPVVLSGMEDYFGDC